MTAPLSLSRLTATQAEVSGSAGEIVRAPLDQLDVGDRESRDDRVAELFRLVGLRPEQQALFPHQFSGGQRQRIGVARALAPQPDLIVCDESVSALDVAIQAQILNLLRRLQEEFGLTYLFISHDLGVVQHMCDDIAVMYLGQVVEHADRLSLFRTPLHPYTNALLSAAPSADPVLRDRASRIRLVGDPPSPIDPPPGCRFASRCPFAEPRCRAEEPALRPVGGQMVRCHLVTDEGVRRTGRGPGRHCGSGENRQVRGRRASGLAHGAGRIGVGYRLDLDQELLLHQPVDDQKRVRRILRAAEELRKQRRPDLHEGLDILGMHHVGRELDDVVEAESGAFQDRAQIVENLAHLGPEVVLADDAAVEPDRKLAGDVQCSAGGDRRGVRVEALGRAGVRQIQIGNCLGRHRGFFLG